MYKSPEEIPRFTAEAVIGPERLEGTTLFYPCAGEDYREPVEVFSTLVADFWFVDTGYFLSPAGSGWGGRVGLGEADQEEGLWRVRRPRLRFRGHSLDGPARAAKEWRTEPDTGGRYPHLDPCVRWETYEDDRPHGGEEGREIRLYWRRGYGQSALRADKRIRPMGVFFHRGDSLGEGGSGLLWYAKSGSALIRVVLEQLVDGGLVVTDGSGRGGRRRNPFEPLTRFYSRRTDHEPMPRSFSDDRGHVFRLLGKIGKRYGPTLVWQVERG